MGAGTVLIAGIVAGLLEEPGWRGYAQDRLQQRHRGLTAALVVGVFWSVWHLPLFFIDGSFQKDLGVGTGKFWLFFLALVLWAVVYAAAYVGTGSSILALVVLHAVANAAAEVISIDGAEGTETLTLALVALAAAGALLRRERRRATR
jgi:membrane protease YdiL (CAAX protease family)